MSSPCGLSKIQQMMFRIKV